jgi:hypothetical protein
MTTPQDLDIAISFLTEDLGFASELRDGLGSSLNVFVYTKRQEELAGTDGLQSLREAFRHRARLVVILHRNGWGKTPWTRVEEEAITDRFLKEGASFLFVVMMDDAPHPPWLPDKLIRFSLKDFGLQEAIGAIKARALEAGSVMHQPSTAFLATRAKEIAEFGKRRAELYRNHVGVGEAEREAEKVVSLVTERVKIVQETEPTLNLRHGADRIWFVIKTASVAVHASYRNRIVNSLSEARFVIRELQGGVLLPGEGGYYIDDPRELAETVFIPELTRAQGWCWKSGEEEILTSEQLADLCVARFFGLIEDEASGKIPSRFF